MGFNPNTVNDAIHAALNQPALTAHVGDRIYRRSTPPDVTPEYPQVVYQQWGDALHGHTLGEGRSDTRLTYRVVVWTDQNPRLANDIAAIIDDLLTAGISVAGMDTVVCRCTRPVDDEQEQPDGRLYQQAGGIYEIGVA